MKNYFRLLFVLFLTIKNYAQEKDYGRVYGGFESNIQRYASYEGDTQESDPEYFRSNNYLQINYEIKKFTFGIQAESYYCKALLNYYDGFEGTDIGLFFANYKSKKFEATLGHFYEQYGSGMTMRAWEDRALGINTAIRGIQLKYKPTRDLETKAFYGKHRTGFKVSNGDLFGADLQANLSNLFKFETSDLSVGISNVNRYEAIDLPNPESLSFSPTTSLYSLRLNYSEDAFYANFETVYKTKDAVLNRISNEISNNFVKDGSSYLLNFGYAKKGLGIDATLRRTENMTFLSDRIPTAVGLDESSLNYFDRVINFAPALTKQHHSNLANIYVYQAQIGVEFKTEEIMKAGETGGQIDVVYEFEKGSSLGGKYGTKVALNYSSWHNLPGSFRATPQDYQTKFWGVGEKYYSDFNVEIKKQLNKDFRSTILYVNQFYNKPWVEDQNITEKVNTHIAYAEIIYNFTNTKSIRLDLEHMWADADFRNWVGGSVEYNFNEKLSVFAMNLVNYGNLKPEESEKHYLTVGSAYRFKSSRVAVSYGRQRGGLVCVGGVCRFVPESTGLTIGFNTAF